MGVEARQLFSTDRYIFKITPSFETLFRYECYTLPDGTPTIKKDAVIFKPGAYNDVIEKSDSPLAKVDKGNVHCKVLAYDNLKSPNLRLDEFTYRNKPIGYKIVKLSKTSSYKQYKESNPMCYHLNRE